MKESYNKPRWPKVGDWFTVPLPDGNVAVGHAVRVVDTVKTLSYFFTAPSTPPTLEACRQLMPADAVTVKVCGGLGVKTGEWVLLGTDEVDPAQWPIPEFERKDPYRPGGASLHVVTRDARLSAVSTVEVSIDEAGLRPPDGAAGHVAAQNYLQHLIDTGAGPIGRQPWWSRRVGTIEPPAPQAPPTDAQAVLLQIPPTWTGDLDQLLDDLAATLPPGSEVDGTQSSPDGTTVYLYGPNADQVADAVVRTAATGQSLAGTAMEVRPGPPGTQEQLRRL